MQVFDSDKEPEVGDLPVRVLRLPPNTLGTVDVHGGRRMKRGIWIAVSNGGNLGFAAAVDNPDTTALLDVAYETHEAKPKPVDLLPILEKLTMRLEALPQVPVTPQATRPANTTKPAR